MLLRAGVIYFFKKVEFVLAQSVAEKKSQGTNVCRVKKCLFQLLDLCKDGGDAPERASGFLSLPL